jgi:hypothetical protein
MVIDRLNWEIRSAFATLPVLLEVGNQRARISAFQPRRQSDFQ